MEATSIISQPIEFIDTVCLDKGVYLTDGSATATLTTEDGESLPVTFIVSQQIPENSNSSECIRQVITAHDVTEVSKISAESNAEKPDGAKTIYTVHFPASTKDTSLQLTEESSKDDTSDEVKSVEPDAQVDNELSYHYEDEDIQTSTNLEDFMDVVTTYKCKFCRFSCPWKSGLVSHIRCCHIRSEKEPNIVTARKDDGSAESSTNAKEPSIQHVYSIKEEESKSQTTDDSNEQPNSPGSEGETDKSFKNSSISERHIFLCGQCSDGFMTLADCKQHMIDDHNIKLDQNTIKPLKRRGRPRTRLLNSSGNDNLETVKVKETKRQSRPPKNLDEDYDFGVKKKPRREYMNEKLFRCTHSGCGHRFSTETNLHYHYRCHAPTGKSFLCPECHKDFEQWRGVVMHLWKDHTMDIDLHTCSECSYKTYSYFKLDNHKKIHSDERAFVCPTCGKGFKQISQLRNHLVIHLDRKNLPEKRWYSEQECDICGRKFSDTKCLRKHQQAVHSKLKPYVCSFCGHLSARKAMLELHMRQHTGEKPFVCEHCDYRTGDHNSLRRHRMRHTGDKPYKCPHCAYACIQAISYKTHLKNKHPGMEGLFSCTLCTFKSVSKENYVNHMSDHKREAESSSKETVPVAEPSAQIMLDSISSDQSSVQMQLNNNTLQQLEGILPGNITAAQLIYSCLNALSQEGGPVNLPAGVTVNIPPGATSVGDGSQTITIQLPPMQETESEYFFTIQDGNATVILPTEDSNNVVQENSELSSVQFSEQDVSDNALQDDDKSENLQTASNDSYVITEIESNADSENLSLQPGSNESYVITQIESANQADPETFTAAIIREADDQD